MSINLKFINFDQILQSNKGDKVFINTVDVYNRHNKEILDKLILSNYTDDNISIIPSCVCGEIKGEYYIGTHCQNCNTTVKPTVEDNLIFSPVGKKSTRCTEVYITYSFKDTHRKI